jgi:hypothetical protein
VDKASALLEVRAAQTALDAASEERDQSILNAIRAGSRLREVAEAAGISHEAVRRIARVLSIGFQLGSTLYEVTDHQADVFVYKLAGFNVGKFPNDLELLDVGTDWLPAAGELASAIERVRRGEGAGPIILDRERRAWGFALYQILRLSYMDRPTDVSRLFDALAQKFGI